MSAPIYRAPFADYWRNIAVTLIDNSQTCNRLLSTVLTFGSPNSRDGRYAINVPLALSDLAGLVGLHHRRSGQQSRRKFQIVEIFTAKVLGKLRIQTLPRNLQNAQHGACSVKNWNRHQLLIGAGGPRPRFGPYRLDRFENTGMLTRAKLLKISAFVLLRAVCARHRLLEIGIAPVVRRCSGKMNLSRPPSSRSSATSAYCT